jgi:hypothetical protein
MRYFFLAYAMIALLVVGIFGIRGQHFSKIRPALKNLTLSLPMATAAAYLSAKLNRAASTRRVPSPSVAFLSMNSAGKPDITTLATSAITMAVACPKS